MHTYTSVSRFFSFLDVIGIIFVLKYKETQIQSKMTININDSKADFQRHLNGCERRLNELKKFRQGIEEFFQTLLLKNTEDEQRIYFNQLNEILSQIEYLDLSISKLNQSSYSFREKKRLESLRINFVKNRIKFEQIQQCVQMKFGYEHEENAIQQHYDKQEDQIKKLINKNSNNDEIELKLIDQRKHLVNHLERDLADLQESFTDLNRIVQEQDTAVNNIEQALTNTDKMVHEATENVKTTIQVKKRYRHVKWILISCFICTLLFLIIIIYFTTKLAFPFR